MTRSTVWFEHRLSARRDALQLFCFPYAGANAQAFGSWPWSRFSEVDLYFINLPGRGKRNSESLARRLLPLVKEIADALQPELRNPFALFGHSMGASLSYELARELHRRHSVEPVRLMVSGCRAPHLPRSRAGISALPNSEVIAELRRLNGTEVDVLNNAELMQILLPTIRADFELLETYEYIPGELLQCPITVYGGMQDSEVPIESLRAWEQLTSSTVTRRMLPGDHFFIHSATFLDVLAADLAALY